MSKLHQLKNTLLVMPLVVLVTLLLSGCGDDSFVAGEADAGAVADIQASADKVQIVADGADFATITVLVRDSSNIGVEGVPVTVSVDRPEAYTLLVDRKNTDSAGTIVARISSREARAGNAVVTARVDNTNRVSNPLGFSFVGSSLVVDPSSVTLGVGEQDTVTARVRDGSGAPAGFTPVCVDLPASLSSDALGPVFGCGLGLLTDENGVATFSVEGIAVGADGILRVSAVGNEFDVPVNVSARNIAFTSPLSDEAFANSETIDVNVQVPGYSGNVRLSTTSGRFSNGMSVITVAASGGQVADTLEAFNSGRVTLLAEKLDASEERASIVFLAFDDTALDPEQTFLALQATPSSLSVGTASQSTLTATATRFVDDQPNAEPVPPGTLVRFEILGSSLGASLSSPLAFTDAAGVATVRLTAGDVASSGEGLRVQACIESLVDKCDEVNIAIVSEPGSISIGLANVLETTNNDTAYLLPVSIIATDITGGALSNVDISVRVWPNRFATGVRDLEGNAIRFDEFRNEDRNRNVIRDLDDGWSVGGVGGLGVGGDRTTCAPAGAPEPADAATFGPAEAFENGCKLLPESTAAGSVPARISTDTNGLATFNLIYLKDRAGFVEAELRATAVVQGTEVQASRVFWLPRLEDDDNLPVSPYNTFFE